MNKRNIQFLDAWLTYEWKKFACKQMSQPTAKKYYEYPNT